jgi:serine/threonine-protein kinase RsbW
MQESVELLLPPDTQLVGLARLVVVASARRAGMDEERVEDLRIAVSEATTNSMRAHAALNSGDRIKLGFGLNERGEFQVTIADTGPGFEPGDPDELAARDWSEEGGLGVTLIRGLTDEVEFVRDDGMHVHLRFAMALDRAS